MTTFKSSTKNLTIYVTVNGRLESVNFLQTNPAQGGGIYRTKNDAIAAEIKKHPDYGKWFVAIEEDEPEQEEEVAENKVYMKSYDDVVRTQEANRILVNEYGVDKTTLRSKEDALRYAEKLNIVFPNLK